MDAKTFAAAAGISMPRALQWLQPGLEAMERFGITTPVRQGDFIAQCGHETMGFARVREIWGPTEAQRGYEGRADLGNTRAGDGRRYMGRGWLQITGRDNYAAASRDLGLDLVRNPQLVEADDHIAALVGAWFWGKRNLNAYADKGDFLGESIRINGKNRTTGLPNGWEDRLARRAVAYKALGVA